jgi:hypothetical protein
MSIHVCKCEHKGRTEYHLRYPGMTEDEAQEIADKINAGYLSRRPALMEAVGWEERSAPCGVCGTPLAEHGSYPTCATHPYAAVAPTQGGAT